MGVGAEVGVGVGAEAGVGVGAGVGAAAGVGEEVAVAVAAGAVAAVAAVTREAAVAAAAAFMLAVIEADVTTFGHMILSMRIDRDVTRCGRWLVLSVANRFPNQGFPCRPFSHH